MSYILNALRKSEKERRAAQSPKLEIGTLDSSPPKKKWISWLLFILLFINIFTVAYFVWFQPQKRTVPILSRTPEEIDRIENNQSIDGRQNAIAKNHPKLSAKALTRILGDTVSGDGPGFDPQESIAEMVNSRRNRVKANTNADISNIVTDEGNEYPDENFRKYIAEIAQRAQIGEEESQVLQDFLEKMESNSRSQFPAEKPIETTTENPTLANIELESTKPSKRKLPKPLKPKRFLQTENDEQPKLLKDMPPEFRRTVPDVNINVFVYDEDIEERFVIIDMKKFKEAQSIAEDMTLEKILPDSLLVRYQGKKFRIKRP